MKKCVVCGRSNDLMSYSEMNRGRRTALVCRDCRKVSNTVELCSTKDSAPVLKDVVNRLMVTAKVEKLAAVQAKIRSKGGDVQRVANSPAKLFLPEKTRLNMAVRFANETLPAMVRMYGVEPTAYTITLKSGSANTEHTYTERADKVDDLASWIRECENDFCKRIGCPQWSALKTGTRTK